MLRNWCRKTAILNTIRDKDSAAFTLEDFDALLKYLPIFEQESYHFYTTTQDDPYHYVWSTEVREFVHAVYRHGFQKHEDYWEVDRAMLRQPALLASADLTTLRKVMTEYIQGDRFCTNYLIGGMSAGIFTAILWRLKQIRDEQIAGKLA